VFKQASMPWKKRVNWKRYNGQRGVTVSKGQILGGNRGIASAEYLTVAGCTRRDVPKRQS
jgi:hypothetical protein